MARLGIAFLCGVLASVFGGFVSQKVGLESDVPAVLLGLTVWVGLAVLWHRRPA